MKKHGRTDSALRVVAPYALFGALWILFSDRLLLFFSNRPDMLISISTAKGWLFILVTSSLLYALVAGEMKRQRNLEKSLSASLSEKDALLAEVHHRVKNNLQIIASILNLERDEMIGEEARHMADRTRARLRSMSLVHEKLYASNELACVDLAVYLRALFAELEDIYDVEGLRVHFDLDPYEAEPETVVSFGLFAAEAIVNSLRHGLDPNNDGEIRLSLHDAGADQALFELRDSGPGFPGEGKPIGLGFSLMSALSDQLHGHFDISNESGAVVRLRFPLKRHADGHCDA